jgi:hypothetical protein
MQGSAVPGNLPVGQRLRKRREEANKSTLSPSILIENLARYRTDTVALSLTDGAETIHFVSREVAP